MTPKRWMAIAAVTVICLFVGIGVVFRAKSQLDTDLADRQQAAIEELDRLAATSDEAPTTTAAETTTTTEPLDPAIIDEGEMVFISRVPGDDYGRLATLDADGERSLLDLTCDRAHASAGMAVCLEPNNEDLFPTWTSKIVDFTDPSLPVIQQVPAAQPSRARVDPRGNRVVTTGFVTGHSYLDVGEFATQTTYIDFARNGQQYNADSVIRADEEPRFLAEDGNWWGAAFDPTSAKHVYLTYGTGDSVEIVRADQSTFRIEPLIENASCPSVSPEGDLIVMRRAVEGRDAVQSLVLHNLNSGEERVLNEKSLVDDQVEWIDNDTILYALPRAETESGAQPAHDIWRLDLSDPDAEPELHLAFADSPAIYRDAR